MKSIIIDRKKTHNTQELRLHQPQKKRKKPFIQSFTKKVNQEIDKALYRL